MTGSPQRSVRRFCCLPMCYCSHAPNASHRSPSRSWVIAGSGSGCCSVRMRADGPSESWHLQYEPSANPEWMVERRAEPLTTERIVGKSVDGIRPAVPVPVIPPRRRPLWSRLRLSDRAPALNARAAAEQAHAAADRAIAVTCRADHAAQHLTAAPARRTRIHPQ